MEGVYDFETITDKTEYYKIYQDTRVILGCGISSNGDKKYDIDIESGGSDILKYQSSQTIYFHNLSGDGDFILKSLKNYERIDANHFRINNRKIKIKYLYALNRIYSIELGFASGKKRNNVKITILDSYKLFNTSVESLGKAFQMEKRTLVQINDENFYHREPYKSRDDVDDDYLAYCYNDCEIVFKMLKTFNYEIEGIEKIKGKYLTSNALADKIKIAQVCRKSGIKYTDGNKVKKFLPKGYYTDYDNYVIGHKFLKGGYTNYNAQTLMQKFENINGVCLDISSSYPYQMKTQYLPIMTSMEEAKRYFNDVRTATFYEIKIKKAVILNVKNPGYFLHDGEGLNRRYTAVLSQECMAYYMKEEGEFLQKFYHFDAEIVKIHTFPAVKLFSSFVDGLYEKKSNAMHPSIAGVYKILLNTGYGSFAKRAIFEEYYESETPLEIGTKIVVNDGEYEVLRECRKQFSNGNAYYIKKTEPPKFAMNVGIAVAITSYARLKLYDAIAIDLNNCLGCDTDSIFLKNGNPAKYKHLLGEKLGDGKVEMEYDQIKVLGPKRYFCYNSISQKTKTAFAGVNKKWLHKHQNEIFNSDELLFKMMNLQRVDCKSGLILQEVDKTIKLENVLD